MSIDPNLDFSESWVIELCTVASFSFDRNSHMWWEAHHSQWIEWGYVLGSVTDTVLLAKIKSFYKDQSNIWRKSDCTINLGNLVSQILTLQCDCMWGMLY